MSNKTKLVQQQQQGHSSFYGAFLGRSSGCCEEAKWALTFQGSGWVVDVEAEWQSRTVGRIRPRWVRALARQGKAGGARDTDRLPLLTSTTAEGNWCSAQQVGAFSITSCRYRQLKESAEGGGGGGEGCRWRQWRFLLEFCSHRNNLNAQK